MSGETNKDESGWTTDTLKYHTDVQIESVRREVSDLHSLLDERHANQTKAVAAAMEATDKAVTKSEASTEKRFESVNEFRGQLSDQAATFLPRSEHEAIVKSMNEKITETQRRLDKAEGSRTAFALMLAATTVVISVIVFFANYITTTP